MNENLKSKFHLISGTYIAGKIFTEYSTLLKDTFNHKIKGDTTRFNRTIEAEAKALKLIDLLEVDLKSIGCDLGITEKEIENIETILYAHLTLSDTGQKRVMNLISKIQKENKHENI